MHSCRDAFALRREPLPADRDRGPSRLIVDALQSRPSSDRRVPGPRPSNPIDRPANPRSARPKSDLRPAAGNLDVAPSTSLPILFDPLVPHARLNLLYATTLEPRE